MQKLPAWVVYNVWRILFIVIPLAILLILLPSYWIFDAIAAVIIGLCLSYILLGRQRARMVEGMRNAGSKRKPARGDAALEDSLLDVDNDTADDDDESDSLDEFDSFDEAARDDASPNAVTIVAATDVQTGTADAVHNNEAPTSLSDNSEK